MKNLKDVLKRNGYTALSEYYLKYFNSKYDTIVEGADTFVRIMSYLGTMSKNGIDSYTAIKAALKGHSMNLLKTVTE